MQEIVISNTSWNELSLPYPLLRRFQLGAGGYPNLGKHSPSKVQMYKWREFSCLPRVPINQQGDFSLWSPLNWKPQGFLQEEKEQKAGYTICPAHSVIVRKVQALQWSTCGAVGTSMLSGNHGLPVLQCTQCPLCEREIISAADIAGFHGV